jgi:hypothetical protein
MTFRSSRTARSVVDMSRPVVEMAPMPPWTASKPVEDVEAMEGGCGEEA